LFNVKAGTNEFKAMVGLSRLVPIVDEGEGLRVADSFEKLGLELSGVLDLFVEIVDVAAYLLG